MKEVEQQIINNIQEVKGSRFSTKEREIVELLEQLTQGPFGTSSAEFINHPDLTSYISTANIRDEEYMLLWLQIEGYLATKQNKTLLQAKLRFVEEELKKYLESNHFTPEDKARGIALLPRMIANKEFMKKLYASNDKHLIALFLKYVPTPRANVFEEKAIPKIIAEREQKSTTAIKDVLTRARNQNKLPLLEKTLIKMQRNFRAKQRKKEDLVRLPFRYEMKTEEAKQLLDDANTPYKPQCEEKLALRIMEAAEKIKLFSTVKHLTAASGLTSIFNDALYGRRSILQFYMPFKPAALAHGDAVEGDGNVICLGANSISPQAKHGIELELDATKITKNNPCVFYKQRDLNYFKGEIRGVRIADLDLFFTSTGQWRTQPEGTSGFTLYENEDDGDSSYAFAKVKNALLISNNTAKMHQILTLNFFRFIDGLCSDYVKKDPATIEKIYAAFNKLNNQQLVDTLQEIGQHLIETMEFNFYGAYKIDFSALVSIKKDSEQPYYDLCPLSSLPSSGNPAPGKIYVEYNIQENELRYTALNSNGIPASGRLDNYFLKRIGRMTESKEDFSKALESLHVENLNPFRDDIVNALLRKRHIPQQYSLHLPSFVEELKAGNVKKLQAAIGQIPEIFNSYRFIDYLLSTTQNKEVITALHEQRKNCVLPAWMESKVESSMEAKTELRK